MCENREITRISRTVIQNSSDHTTETCGRKVALGRPVLAALRGDLRFPATIGSNPGSRQG